MRNLILIIALFFTACATNDKSENLAFLKDLGENKIIFSESEKIERIKNFYKEKLKNIDNLQIDFIKKIPANEDLKFDAFIFNFTIDKLHQKEILFVKDNYFFSDFGNLENLKTSKEKIQKIIEKENNENILNELENDKEFIITLGNGQKEQFIFSDPLCPFCKESLLKIDEEFLKNHTIHFIFVSVHGEAGFNRANLIYENVKKANDDLEKLEIIKNYFEDNINQEPIFAEKSITLKNLFDKYQQLGVNFVPFIIEK